MWKHQQIKGWDRGGGEDTHFVVQFLQWLIQHLLAHQLTHHALKELSQRLVILGFKQRSQVVVR
jgi:hypothetical protein